MNSPLVVGLDVLGIGMRCLGEENELIWYEKEITMAIACTGILWLGFLGLMTIMGEGLVFTAIS
jgi:hypothetical protein